MRDFEIEARKALRTYPIAKKALLADIANAQDISCHYPQNDLDMLRGTDTGNPTLGGVIRAEQLWNTDRGKRILAVESVYEALDKERKRLVEMKYWKKDNWLKISMELNICKSTLYNWDNDIVCSVCESLEAAGMLE